jgi:hypothetical protein
MKTDEAKFHESRVAFLIINNDILFLKDSEMSHREWFNALNINVNFEDIVRGYYKDNQIIVYKGDFIFDDETIEIAYLFYPIIVDKLRLTNPELWCGLNKKEVSDPINDPWLPTKRLK